jgi:hypothetical protein
LTDLERFFRRMVSNLAATDAPRLRAPLPLADILVSIVPYRSNRRALGLESSEEYEMVLLRLCAGEGGFARTDPEDVRQTFVEAVASANPDLEVLHRFEDVTIILHPGRVEQALLRGTPPHVDDVEEVTAEEVAEDDAAVHEESSGSQCVYCGGALPGRPVNFCPHCGQSQVAMVCPDCHADVEAGWRHCVNCGVALGAR